MVARVVRVVPDDVQNRLVASFGMREDDRRFCREIDCRTPPPDDKSWRTVLLMCGNFGLAGGWDETRELLRRLQQVCAVDAVLVADAVDGPLVRLRLRYGELTTPWWDLLNLPPSDVIPLIDGTGWSLEAHIEDGSDHAMRLRRS